MKKWLIVIGLLISIVGIACANGFKYQRNYNNTSKEEEVKDLLVYQIGNITIQGQFDDGIVSYFVNDVYIVEGVNYRMSGYDFYTHDGNFYLYKYGNMFGDNFSIEPIYDNPFADVNPFAE